MPTGYTADVKIDTPFNAFAMKCARAMGALIEMRDERMDANIPEGFKPSTYHHKEQQKATATLSDLVSMSAADAAARAEEDFQERLGQHRKFRDERIQLRAAYERMLVLVKAWAPPSSDHANFKEFMIEQLKDSIKHDCDMEYYDKPPQPMSGDAWRAQAVAEATRNADYHTKAYYEECERTASRNLWLKQLRQSLGQPVQQEA